MRFLYTGDSKKENIEKFVVDALNDVFTEVDVFEENCEMKDALNYLFAVRNRLNVVRGMFIDAFISTMGGSLTVVLKYGGKEFDPQFVNKSDRTFSNRGYSHIVKALNSLALIKYKIIM